MSPKRIIVLGGFGFFGAAAVERLRADGFSPLIGSRRSEADVSVDIEDGDSIRKALKPEDVVIDTVGPFQARSSTLLECALEIGFDLIDISDSLEFCKRIYEKEDRIRESGCRVLTACSSVSAMSAMLIRHSEIHDPIRIAAILAPATRYVAAPGTSESLVYSIGQPVSILEDGVLVTRKGWRSSRTFELPPPLNIKKGHLFESADAVMLPHVWPSLKSVSFFVHSNVFGLDTIMSIASWISPARWLLRKTFRLGLPLVRLMGSPSGCLAYAIEDAQGKIHRYAFVAEDRGYYTPIVPAVLAAEAIVQNRFQPTGLVPADQQVRPDEVFSYLSKIGVIPLVRRPDSKRYIPVLTA